MSRPAEDRCRPLWSVSQLPAAKSGTPNVDAERVRRADGSWRCSTTALDLDWNLGLLQSNSMTFGPPAPDLMRGARNAVGTCLGIKAGERVALIADQASAAVAASLEAALAEHQARTDAVLIEAVTGRPMRSAPPRDSRRARACRRGHPVRAAAGRRTAGAHGDRRTGRAPPDPLCAHGRRDAADHARGPGGGLPAGRSPQPAAVRAHAARRRGSL